MPGAPSIEKVLVSACLLGSKVRYNASAKLSGDAVLDRWLAEGRVVSLCTEVAAGFPTPRPPAEIRGEGGEAVLAGKATVIEDTSGDVGELYRDGARIALEVARENGCRYAVLTDGSPSCGSSLIYDGTFSGRRIAGRGVTTALLEANGIRVFPESRLAELDSLLHGAAGAAC